MLSIRSNLSGNTLNIALEGNIDIKTSSDLEAEINSKIDQVTEINFDFAKLEFLTSAGLRVLLAAQQEMEDKGGTMTLKNVNDEIMDVFNLTGFVDVLTIV